METGFYLDPRGKNNFILSDETGESVYVDAEKAFASSWLEFSRHYDGKKLQKLIDALEDDGSLKKTACPSLP